jgi:hypothetical protein
VLRQARTWAGYSLDPTPAQDARTGPRALPSRGQIGRGSFIAASRTRLGPASTAGPDIGEGIGQHNGGAVEQIDARKALHEGNGDGIARHYRARRRFEDTPQKLGGGRCEALLQPLR